MSYFKLLKRPFTNILPSLMVSDLAKSVGSVPSILKLSLDRFIMFHVSKRPIFAVQDFFDGPNKKLYMKASTTSASGVNSLWTELKTTLLPNPHKNHLHTLLSTRNDRPTRVNTLALKRFCFFPEYCYGNSKR